MQLTEKVIDFLLMMKNNKGMVVKSEQEMFDSVRYYMMVGYLFKIGLITCDGFDVRNQKVWKLSEKGTKITDLLFQIREVYYGNGQKKGKGFTPR
jgi:hypothetical protein